MPLDSQGVRSPAGERTFSFAADGREVLRRAVFVVGPTSVGKSGLAIRWAAEAGGEIVNADAFQLYREFPVLSAQPSESERDAVPHHLFGSVGCDVEMDAARYAEEALGVITGIAARGKTPFVVGGSGLYIQALVAGLPDLPPIDPALRLRVREMGLPAMQQMLGLLDPRSAESIDMLNPRRVSRRLELCLQSGRAASELLAPRPVPDGLRGVFLVRDREDLHARIARAVAARLAGGAVEEVRGARNRAGLTARQILGWKEIVALIDGAKTAAECGAELVASTRCYAKRQLTWFRAKSTFPTVNLSSVTPDFLDRLARELAQP